MTSFQVDLLYNIIEMRVDDCSDMCLHVQNCNADILPFLTHYFHLSIVVTNVIWAMTKFDLLSINNTFRT